MSEFNVGSNELFLPFDIRTVRRAAAPSCAQFYFFLNAELSQNCKLNTWKCVCGVSNGRPALVGAFRGARAHHAEGQCSSTLTRMIGVVRGVICSAVAERRRGLGPGVEGAGTQ